MCHKETNSWYFPMIFPGNLKISAPASSALSMSLRPLIPCQDLNLRLQDFQILTSESWASKEKNLCIMSIVNYKNTYIYVINIHTYMLYIHIYVCIFRLKSDMTLLWCCLQLAHNVDSWQPACPHPISRIRRCFVPTNRLTVWREIWKPASAKANM